jgi:hypothetical protein
MAKKKVSKPCPCCGSASAEAVLANSVFFITEEPSQQIVPWEIECLDCGLSTGAYENEEDAWEAWNTRPGEDELRDEISVLTQKLSLCVPF